MMNSNKRIRFFCISILSFVAAVCYAPQEKQYSMRPIVDVLQSIIKLRDTTAETPRLNAVLARLNAGYDLLSQSEIRLCLMEAWQVMEKHHAKVDASTLTTWVGRIIEFSLQCDIRDDDARLKFLT